jgi:hypothetical protein
MARTVQLKRENILMNDLEGISTVLKNTFVTHESTQCRCWIFSWAMSHIGATNRGENIVIRYVHLQIFRSAFAQIFPRSQPMRESNTSN